MDDASAAVAKLARNAESSQRTCAAGQVSDLLGPRGSPVAEPLCASGRARCSGTAADASSQRHVPRLDSGRAGEPLPLLARAARHEGIRRRRGHAASTGWALTQACAARLSLGPAPGRVTRSRSRHTSARRIGSTSRSRISPRPRPRSRSPQRSRRVTASNGSSPCSTWPPGSVQLVSPFGNACRASNTRSPRTQRA